MEGLEQSSWNRRMVNSSAPTFFELYIHCFVRFTEKSTRALHLYCPDEGPELRARVAHGLQRFHPVHSAGHLAV